MSSKATEPIRRPAPSAMTMAMNFRLGEATYATTAPMSSAEAPTAPQKNASPIAGLP